MNLYFDLLSESRRYRRRPNEQLQQETLTRDLTRNFRSERCYGLDGNRQSYQRRHLYCMVCGNAKRTTFVIYLADGMRVRNLDYASEQNERDADYSEPTCPGMLKTLFCIWSAHVRSNIAQNQPIRKTRTTLRLLVRQSCQRKI